MRTPPLESNSIVSDLRHFFLRRPPLATVVEFNTREEREDYSQRILQRVGVQVSEYAILNIHRIGIDAPVRHVFDEFLGLGGSPPCWPNHVARLEQEDGGVEQIRVVLFGGLQRLHRRLRGLLGPNVGTLFRMQAVRFQRVPPPSDADSARYALYECHGGYPVGVLIVYARSPVAGRGESEPTQLFFGVGFNIYGKRGWSGIRLVNRIWERIHNRVTANVLNRFKQLCEARFDQLCAALREESDAGRRAPGRTAVAETAAATPENRPGRDHAPDRAGAPEP